MSDVRVQPTRPFTSRRAICALVAAAGLSLALSPSASAARAHVVENCDKYGCLATVEYLAAPGEANVVRATETQVPSRYADGSYSPQYTITDGGANVSAGRECKLVDAHTVQCTPQADAIDSVTFRLGDRDDRLDATALGTIVVAYGGPGDDVLRTGNAYDTLTGGPGHDVLDGAGGENTAVFDDSHGPARVDLEATAPQGQPGSEDRLRNIQDVTATATAHDALRGDDQNNRLTAGPSSVVDGRGGSDVIEAGSGSSVDGGPGDDQIDQETVVSARRGAGNRVGCGRGDDLVYARFIDTAAADCENVTTDPESEHGFGDLVARPRPGRPFVSLLFQCLQERGTTCEQIAGARLGSRHGPVVALRRVRQRAGPSTGTQTYPLRLNPRGERLLRHRGRLRVIVFEQATPWRDRRTHRRHVPAPDGFTTTLHAP